jgi:serralysin
MCVLCVSAGKAPGGPECSEAGSEPADGSSGKGTLPADTTAAPEAPGTDGVGGTTSTTGTMAFDTAVRGFINTVGDQDWYRVTLVAGQTYTFAMNGMGQGALRDSILSIKNSSGTTVASDDDSGPLSGALLTYTATATGTYYVAASAYSTYTGQYQLTMNDGATPFIPVVIVADVADYLTHTYWEVNGATARHWGASTISFNVVGLEAERAALARTAFQLWSDVANLTFVETLGGANITLDDTQSGAYATSTVNGSGVITSSFINVATNWYGGIDTVDSYTLQTFVHEIGHALGLGHAGPYNGTAGYGVDNVYANDTWQLSLMSYMAQSNYDGVTYRFTMSPMMADILAIQNLYGASNARSGNTVYGFGSTAGSIYDFAAYASAPSLTIYDAGGTDTLDASGYGQAQLIDLRGGRFSNIGGLVGNVGVYTTAVIENAVGGSGNDTIYGNDANNTLRGNAGNDAIDGGLGTDYAVFSGVRAAYTLTALGGTSVQVSGPDGVDILTNIEYLVFNDQTVTWPPTDKPDLDALDLVLGAPSVNVGSSTTVSYTVTNVGSVAAAASTVGIYLSTNNTFDSGDTLLTVRSVAALNAGASFNDSFSLTLTTVGGFYLFAVADYNNVMTNELTEANNPSNGAPISVIGPLLLVGSGGSETITGWAGNDTLRGMAGNDTLNGGLGDDHIDGGAGDDTAVFSHGFAAYTVRDHGNRIVISGPDGNDTLVNVEHLRFADGTVHLNDGNALFDSLYYLRNNLDIYHAGVDPLAHYRAWGWREGRNPNEFFDSRFYASTNPEILRTGESPIDHYDRVGWRQGSDPSMNFDTTWYLTRSRDVAAAGMNPLAHYLAFGQSEGRSIHTSIGQITHGAFDAQFYLLMNSDVARAGIDPYAHYSGYGWKEGRDPNAFFDTSQYLTNNPDVAAAGMNPFLHYEAYGWKEGRSPSTAFSVAGYLVANPDVAAANMNPLDHYLNFGIYEGRALAPLGWH